jgi:predicted dehydrogenase
MHHFNINRRRFLKSSSAMLAVSALGLPGLDIIFPRQSRKVGLIGSGWYGTSDVLRLIQVADVEVTAICDVDQQQLETAGTLIQQRQKSGKKPRFFKDYRKMLANEEFDLVLIGSPDHWHALHAIEAMEAGAHLYLQKPISHDIAEGEAIVAAAQKYKRTVQIGTQRRSTPHLVDAKKKVVDAGLLGEIGHVEMCCYYHMRMNAQPPVQDIPAGFDYDRWSGPAPLLPFRGKMHRSWRSFKEYGNGIVGDMCVHMLDTVRWMLDLGWPQRIHSTGGIYVQNDSIANIPDTQTATFEFEDFNCIWKHRTWGNPPDPEYPWAFFIYGEKGVLKGSVHKCEFYPTGAGEPTYYSDALYERERYPEDLKEKGIELHVVTATRRHFLNLLEAIDTGSKPVADVMNGHISTASCILANMALETGDILEYDPARQKIVKNRNANKLLEPDYRSPWQRPKI